MMRNKDDFIDDGRTIADMSEVGHKTAFTYLTKKDDDQKEKMPASTRWAYIWGALKAALLIGLVYGTVYFLAILVMTLFFKNK